MCTLRIVSLVSVVQHTKIKTGDDMMTVTTMSVDGTGTNSILLYLYFFPFRSAIPIRCMFSAVDSFML